MHAIDMAKTFDHNGNSGSLRICDILCPVLVHEKHAKAVQGKKKSALKSSYRKLVTHKKCCFVLIWADLMTDRNYKDIVHPEKNPHIYIVCP
jgi:hypothetical protein